MRDEPAGGGPDDADANGAGDLMLKGSDVGLEGVDLGLDPPRPGNGEVTGARQASCRAVDEGRVELALQLLDVSRDIRLHGEQGVRGGGERTVVGDCDEGVELAKFHRKKRYSISPSYP